MKQNPAKQMSLSGADRMNWRSFQLSQVVEFSINNTAYMQIVLTMEECDVCLIFVPFLQRLSQNFTGEMKETPSTSAFNALLLAAGRSSFNVFTNGKNSFMADKRKLAKLSPFWSIQD